MLKAALVYASQNGSTRKVALRIMEEFTGKGTDVTLFDTSSMREINIDDYGLVGIGCPTYISRPSYEIMDFLDFIGDFKMTNVFTFVTFSSEIGDGANLLRKKIKRRNGADVGHWACFGKNLFPGYTKNGYVFCPGNPDGEDLQEIEDFVDRILLRTQNCEKTDIDPYDRKPLFLYRFERFVTNRFFANTLYRHFFRFDKTLCSDCGSCLGSCPRNNLSKDVKGDIKLGSACILCLNCEISCPQQAVSSPLSDWYLFKPFLKANIRKAVKKGIPYELVASP